MEKWAKEQDKLGHKIGSKERKEAYEKEFYPGERAVAHYKSANTFMERAIIAANDLEKIFKDILKENDLNEEEICTLEWIILNN